MSKGKKHKLYIQKKTKQKKNVILYFWKTRKMKRVVLLKMMELHKFKNSLKRKNEGSKLVRDKRCIYIYFE